MPCMGYLEDLRVVGMVILRKCASIVAFVNVSVCVNFKIVVRVLKMQVE